MVRVYYYHNIFTTIFTIYLSILNLFQFRFVDSIFVFTSPFHKRTGGSIKFTGKYTLISKVGHNNCSKEKLISYKI